MKKECHIDTETGGTDPKKNALIQIAGIIVIDGVEVSTFDFRPAPFPNDVIEDSALAVNHITREQLAKYNDPLSIHQEFTKVLALHVDKFDKKDKYFFVGYNARFDADFLREFFTKCKDNYFGSWFWFPPLCVMDKAAFSLIDKRPSMPDFKLATVAAEFSLKPEGDLHDAFTDIRLTKQLFDKVK